MSLNYTPQTVQAEAYEYIFGQERLHTYPEVEALEERLGFSVDRERLESAARVLSCPMKAAPPNWQHGRVIYAVTRAYLDKLAPISVTETGVVQSVPSTHVSLLDIGTAKGFSALCLEWALQDALAVGTVTSIDVMNPTDRVRRNTIAEVHSLRTLYEILEPWPEAKRIRFEKIPDVAAAAYKGAVGWLLINPWRFHAAFIDGKHTYDAVSRESKMIAEFQQSGDVIIFDDIQIVGIRQALGELKGYDVERLASIPGKREYAIARKQ